MKTELQDEIIQRCKDSINDCPEFYFSNDCVKDLYTHMCNQSATYIDTDDLKELFTYRKKKYEQN